MKIGLSLGSGSARGYSHLSIIKELVNNDIKPDCVSGSSIGAAIGAYYALNLETDHICKLIRSFTKRDLLKLIDLNNPKISLIKGKKIKKFFEKMFFKNYTFEQTKIPLIICATDLEHKKSVYFREGLIIDAVMASISIPGIFPPYKIDNHYYIDGGVLDPVPYESLLEIGMHKIIGINVNSFAPKAMKNRNVFNVLRSVFGMMMNEIQKKQNNKNLFMLNPTFDIGLSDSFRFYQWEKFRKPGEIEIKKQMPLIKKWLKE